MTPPCFFPPGSTWQFLGPVGLGGEVVLAQIVRERDFTRAILVVNETKRRDSVAAFIYRARKAAINCAYDRAVKGGK